jgi:hypothetical protein
LGNYARLKGEFSPSTQPRQIIGQRLASGLERFPAFTPDRRKPIAAVDLDPAAASVEETGIAWPALADLPRALERFPALSVLGKLKLGGRDGAARLLLYPGDGEAINGRFVLSGEAVAALFSFRPLEEGAVDPELCPLVLALASMLAAGLGADCFELSFDDNRVRPARVEESLAKLGLTGRADAPPPALVTGIREGLVEQAALRELWGDATDLSVTASGYVVVNLLLVDTDLPDEDTPVSA